VCFRKAEDLQALKQVWNGTTVYIGDNPIAMKLQLHLLQPQLIPGARPGTVQLSCDAREPVSTTLLAEGMQRHVHHDHPCARFLVPEITGQRLRGKYRAESVVLKISRKLPNRPTLAKSIMRSIMSVKRDTAHVACASWRTDESASEKLLHMFDTLKRELSKWEQMDSVPEETISETQHSFNAPRDPVDTHLEPAVLNSSCMELPVDATVRTHEPLLLDT